MFQIIYVLLLLTFSIPADSWNPDAGYITSWTKMAGVTATATSRSEDAGKILDNDDNTHWMSASCLPSAYISRADENVFFGACARGLCTDESGLHTDLSKLTDGSVYTLEQLALHTNGQSHNSAMFSLRLPTIRNLHLLSIWGVYNGNANLIAEYQNGTSEQLKILQHSDNYKQVTINHVLRGVSKISIQSHQTFKIKEIAALSEDGCKESAIVDLGVPREVGVIRTRHWAGSGTASALTLKTSIDNVTWTTVASLIPDALHGVKTSLIPSKMVKYIKLEYNLVLKNYNKVYCWEVDAWDQYQQWGRPIVTIPQENTIRQILGVNGIWGWQHSKYSSDLKAGEGPTLYNAVASHARNYHNLDWDITDPSKDPQYSIMARGGGTQAKSWLNWDTEYKAWRNGSLLIDVSIQFTNKNFPQSKWYNPEQEAFNIGRHFANHFGSDHGNGLINAAEIGNEPWDYNSNFYNSILKGMSAGMRSIDAQIKILPGAFQAHEKHDTGNYIGMRVTQDLATNISVVNFHTYSYKTTNNGVRVATYPEDKDSSFNSIRNIVRWRDSNMSIKPIWVTEWGWDADGKGEGCSFPECVSEEAQAIYGIRGLLILARSNVQKVTWFFYANSQSCHTLYCRSGLTASIKHNFSKKSVFYAFEQLHSLIGNKYFLGIYQEDTSSYVYAYSSSSHYKTKNITTSQELLKHASHIVAWKPTGISDSSKSQIQVTLPLDIYPTSVKMFTGQNPAITDMGTPNINGNFLTLDISTHPVLVELSSVNTGHVVG